MLHARRGALLALLCILLLCGPALFAPVAAQPLPASIALLSPESAPDPLSGYIAEILRAEGWMSVAPLPLATLTLAELQRYPLAILPRCALTAPQRALISAYVANGGRLLALRPDPNLAGLFGLTASGTTQIGGYLSLDSRATPASGLPTSPLQLHTSADRYALTTATPVGWLATTANSTSAYPAIVTASSGQGQTAAFTYDLAANIALTRQGNPANATFVSPISGITGDIDGDGVVRTVDSFMGQNGGAPWLDRDQIGVPQADIQMRLLSRLIQQLSPVPLPQLWYHPDGKKTILVLTGDAHANPLSYYTQLLNDIGGRGGRMTIYLSKTGELSTSAGQQQLQQWRAAGHTVGVHPYATKPDNHPAPITTLAEGYRDIAGADGNGGWFASAVGGPKSRTVRHHQVAWQGWAEAARIAADHGIALDTNYYSWGKWLRRTDGSWPHGSITGSNRPMRFIQPDGSLLSIYQQPTQLIDEQLFNVYADDGEYLDAAQATAVSVQLLEASERGDYAVIAAQFHVDYFSFGAIRSWAEATVDAAISRQIPVWNADDLLQFTQARAATVFQNTTWDPTSGTLSFSVTSGVSPASLTIVAPTVAGAQPFSAEVGGSAAPLVNTSVDGRAATFFTIPAGSKLVTLRYPPQVVPGTAVPTFTSPATATPAQPAQPTPTPPPVRSPSYLPLIRRA